jgi:hypothetical protein
VTVSSARIVGRTLLVRKRSHAGRPFGMLRGILKGYISTTVAIALLALAAGMSLLTRSDENSTMVSTSSLSNVIVVGGSYVGWVGTLAVSSSTTRTH